MPEYHFLRLVLSILELAVAVTIMRGKSGSLFAWAIYCYAAGTADLIPAMMRSQIWAQAIWMPLRACLLLLLVWAVFDAYRFVVPYTRLTERLGLTALGILVAGILLIPLSRTWAPSGRLQTFMRAREFIAIALAACHSTCWFWVRWYRPVPASALVRRHGLLLVGWLWIYWLASTSAEGGTLWLVRWENEMLAWRWCSGVTMGTEIGLMVGWMVALRR